MQLNQNTTLLFLWGAIGLILILLTIIIFMVVLFKRTRNNVTSDELKQALIKLRGDVDGVFDIVAVNHNSLIETVKEGVLAQNSNKDKRKIEFNRIDKELKKQSNQIYNQEAITAHHSKYIRAVEDEMELFRKTKIKVKVVSEEIKQVEPTVENVKEETFSLPEKWYIRITDTNKDILYKYWKTLGIDIDYNFKGFLCSKYHLDNSCLCYNEDRLTDYTEITFEQFDKYVLKLNVAEPKPSYKEQRNHVHYTRSLEFGKNFTTVCGKYSKRFKKGLNVTTLESNVTCKTCIKLINKIK